MAFHISNQHYSIDELCQIIHNQENVGLSDTAKDAIIKCRKYLDKKISEVDSPIYGINTGFGSLYKNSISNENLALLQVNLVRSHACGMGEHVPEEIVRWMLLLKAIGLSFGHSGVQLPTVERLVELLNEDCIPEVFQQGSLGASGDLAPLAHLSLTLLGEGKLWKDGELRPSNEVLNEKGWKPIELQAKEGLALLNGTQFMSGYGCYLYNWGKKLLNWSNAIAAISLDAFDGRIEPFGDEVHLVRKQPGQIHIAREMRRLLEGSELIQQKKKHVQDPYSFRCIPQVHGASYDALIYYKSVLENEINSVTDNPTIFPDQDIIVSAGNFHGQPLALATDYFSLAMAELGSISERRTYKLISGFRDLPEFLVKNPGLNSGFMIPQYTSASIVSQNKQLASPASIDTIDSSNGQEDHVSMGANAVTKTYRILDNLEKILAIEMLNAIQAIEFRKPLRTSSLLEKIISDYRREIPFVEDDVIMHDLIEKSRTFIRNNSI